MIEWEVDDGAGGVQVGWSEHQEVIPHSTWRAWSDAFRTGD
ncbi:MAG: hypothetical protein ACIAQ0_12415 [Phycisphaerales bacterium JB058]